jgi:hypothetical protein
VRAQATAESARCGRGGTGNSNRLKGSELWAKEERVHGSNRWLLWAAILGGAGSLAAFGQIDPYARQLLQFGYNAPLEGHAPLQGYAFYYWNKPELCRSNLAFRLAVAPTYLDSELGIRQALGEHTDLGVGIAGGAFADSYEDFDQGSYYSDQSYYGFGGETSLSLYHRFNPDQRVPLNAILRGIYHYSAYVSSSQTAPDFELPPNHGTYSVRTGLRFGGKEPLLFPTLAMEVSVWYEGQFRTAAGSYGFNGDRPLNWNSQLFWGQSLLAYTFQNSGRAIYLNLIGGSSVNADRTSAYRLGAFLPLVGEFPLTLPGYYYQEISARAFVLVGGTFILPIVPSHRWNLMATADTSWVNYIPGLAQPGNWLSGVAGGIVYKTSSVKLVLGYAYGIDAIRSGSRGANSIGFLMQFDLERAKIGAPNPEKPGRWNGWQQILGAFVH